MITKLELKGLRGFASTQTLELAIPNGSFGSGFTALVGPNNGGKSTIIEALRALSSTQPPSFTVGKRNAKAGDRVEIVARDEAGNTRELRTVEEGGSEAKLTVNNDPIPPGSMFVLPSRRFFEPLFPKGLQERYGYITGYGLPATRGSAIGQFATRLFQVSRNKKEFGAVLKRVLDPVPNWTIDQSDGGQYFLKFDMGGSFHNSDGLGEGLVSLFFIIDALYDSGPGDVIVIDEPELSLHPAFQRKLASLLLEYASSRQIVISTHSPYFIDFGAVVNGAKIARVYSKQFDSTIKMLSDESAKRIEGFLKNLNNPHILGLDAREVFFLEDRVILVEGQEDVVFYHRIAEQLGKNLHGTYFGWGVGGADNMGIIAHLLRDLGFEKVVGILDDNKQDALKKLVDAFPDYHFFSIPANDVRSKPAVAAKGAVVGVVDEAGNVKPEHTQALTALFDSINAELSP